MFLVELVSLLSLGELAHFKLANSETALVDCIDDLARLSVTVRFHHGKGTPCRGLESALGEDVCIVNQLQLARVHAYLRANEQFSHADTLHLVSLHENPLVLQIILHSC